MVGDTPRLRKSGPGSIRHVIRNLPASNGPSGPVAAAWGPTPPFRIGDSDASRTGSRDYPPVEVEIAWMRVSAWSAPARVIVASNAIA